MVPFTQIFRSMSASRAAFSSASPALGVLLFALPQQRERYQKWYDAKAICTEKGYDLYHP